MEIFILSLSSHISYEKERNRRKPPSQSFAISRCNQRAVLLGADARNDCDRRAQGFKLVMRVNLVRFRRCVAGEFLPDFL